MKRITLALLLLLPTVSFAQEEKPAPVVEPGRALGLFAQSEGQEDNGSLQMIGLQYNSMKTEHLGFRVIAGFAQYFSNHSQLQFITNDTSYSKDEQLRINLPVLGFGLEAQRHFYKRVYLFAAMEIRGGYGNGNTDTLVSISSGHSSPTSESFGSHDASLLYFGLNASVGARIQYHKLSVGLEMLPIQGIYSRISYNDHNEGRFDLNLGSFSSRISVQYRF